MDERICSVSACGKSGPLRRGWCTLHYQRWQKHGDATREAPKAPETCTESGCDRPHEAKGLCQTHYMRKRRTGTTADPDRSERQRLACAIDSCDTIEHRKGWCSVHYNRWKKHGDPQTLMRERNCAPPETCTIVGCSSAHRSKGLCFAHYQQAHHVAHQDVRNERMRQHYRDNREAYYAKANRRRQIVKVAMDKLDRALSADYRQAIRSDSCVYCGAPGAHVDHFFPLAKGGTDHWWNLVRACEHCNKSKAARCGTWFALRTGGVREPRRAPALA